MPIILAGEKITAARLNAQCIKAVKSADESVTSSTTLQDDNHLSVTVEASTTYLFEFQFIYNAPVAAGGFKMNFVAPTSTTGVVAGWEQATGNGFTAAFLSQINWAANANDRAGWYSGRVVTSTTAGTLKLQWAQNTSNAAAVVLRQGSFIRLVPVA